MKTTSTRQAYERLRYRRPERLAYMRVLYATPKQRARKRLFDATPEAKAKKKARRATPAYRAVARAYENASPVFKALMATPHHMAAKHNRVVLRRLKKAQRTPAWADLGKIARVYQEAAEWIALGIDVDVDHVIPLRGQLVSGLHVHENLQILSKLDNQRKNRSFTPLEL